MGRNLGLNFDCHWCVLHELHGHRCLCQFLIQFGDVVGVLLIPLVEVEVPQMNRPYRVPLRLPALIVMCLVPSAFLVFIMAIATKTVYLVSGLMTIGGIGWFFLMNVCKSRTTFQEQFGRP
ncbi:putative polyamine transporter [Sesamum angolense]|uniref:Polyamine transporter n=1 Tax=Sesamum angolense TaxID=2727404 RepID=A0AAE2C4T2_9LAMI|nr:putative polyamine transporter [Sesamum angolense]